MRIHRWVRILAISNFCLCIWFPLSSQVQAADQKEQSPEEAAGGRMNLLRIKKACEGDVKKLCPDIRPGGGRLLQCLRGQPDSLSPGCRQVMDSQSGNRR